MINKREVRNLLLHSSIKMIAKNSLRPKRRRTRKRNKEVKIKHRLSSLPTLIILNLQRILKYHLNQLSWLSKSMYHKYKYS